MKDNNKLFRFVKPALFVSVFALAAGTLYAWSAPPSGTPPTCPPGLTGCDAPINVSNNLQSKNGNLMVNAGGSYATGFAVPFGNVGIGTAAPAQRLEVFGNILQQNQNILMAKNAAGVAENWMWPRWSDNVMYTNFGSAGWNIRNNASVSSMFLQNSGNVGIGTTAPEGMLTIGSANPTINLGSTGVSVTDALIGRAGGLNFHVTGTAIGDLAIRPEATKRIIFGTTPTAGTVGTARAVIDMNGNVGIGTLTPGQKLDVAGNINVPTGSCFMVNGTCLSGSAWFDNRGYVPGTSLDTSTLNGIYGVSNTGYSSSMLVFNEGGSLGPFQLYADYWGSLKYRNQTDSTTWNPWRTILTTADAPGGIVGGSGTQNYVPKWNNAAGTTLGNSSLIDNGDSLNMPGEWKIARTGAWGADTLEIHSNAWAGGAANADYGGLSAGHGYYYGGLQSGGGSGNEAASGELYVAGTSKLMGNVGIGTVAPAAKLDVDGNITQSVTHGNNVKLWLSGARNGGGTGEVGLYSWVSEPGQTWTGAGLARNMYNTTGFPRVNTGLSGQMLHFTEGGNVEFTLETAAGARTTPVAILNNGNVGVGTLSPAAKLHVVGAIGATDWVGAGCEGGCEAGGGYAILYPSGYLSLTGTNIYGSGGNVGIGIASPAYRLDLNGGTLGYGNANTRTEGRADAGAMGGQSGFYETSAPAPAGSWPPGAGSWWHLLDVRHSNTGNNYAMQIAGSFFDQNLWFRKTNGSGATAWSRLLSTADAPSGICQSNGTNCPAMSGAYLPLAGGTMNAGSIIGFNGSGSYGVGVGAAAPNKNSIAVDTVETDPGGTLELNYYGGNEVHIGQNGSKPIRFGSVPCINTTCPPNGAVRMTPNLHLNAGTNYGLIVNWDNGATADWSVGQFTVGNGAGASIFNVLHNGNVSMAGDLQFTKSNPYISAPSYFIAPGGAYFNGGTVYTEATIQARGGIHSDTTANLNIYGGTSGNTWFSGAISTNGSSVFAQNDNSNTSYWAAPIQLREAQYGATGGYLPPRISFHWGGVVASQIAIESDGTIAIKDNPGTGYEKLKAGAFYYPSDLSLKTHIQTIPNALEKILRLRGVEFLWKKNNAPSVGLVAQEVEKVFPQLVSTDQDGLKSVEYGNLVAPLIEAVKEQQREIETLKARITVLEQK